MTIFEKAKQAGAKLLKKKVEAIELDDVKLFNKLKRHTQLAELIEQYKVEYEQLNSDIKLVAKKKWVTLYQENEKNPGSITLIAKNKVAATQQYMFIPQDRYNSIDEVTAKYLQTQYGKTVINKTETFSFNNDVLKKYDKVISKLIMNCKEISDDDKTNLIVKNTTISVAKGIINKLLALTKKKSDLNTVIDDFKPVFSVRVSK